MKLYTEKITSCEHCPACEMDDNITRFTCKKKNYRTIAWYDSEKEVEIPEWCPLEDVENDEVMKKRLMTWEVFEETFKPDAYY